MVNDEAFTNARKLARKTIRKKIQSALQLDFPYQFRPSEFGRKNGKPAAVLILISLSEDPDRFEILMTRRTDRVESHKGQYALPGGMKDEEDDLEEGLKTTALRETEEEMGISRDLIEVLGCLPEIWVPSGFLVQPWVGVLKPEKNEIQIQENPYEIDFWFWVSKTDFFSPGVYRTESHQVGEVQVQLDVFQIGEHRIWGATAAILKNFFGRLEKSD